MNKFLINRDLIFDFMESNKLSTGKFCKMCKISPLVLAKLLLNDFNLKVSNVLQISRTLNVELKELFAPELQPMFS